MTWIDLGSGSTGPCISGSDCSTGTYCYGLVYTPDATGILTDYTTGFISNCVGVGVPVISNESCIMNDNSNDINGCPTGVLFNSSGNSGSFAVTAGTSYIIHQVCFTATLGETISIVEDTFSNLTTSIDLSGGGAVTDEPLFVPIDIVTACSKCNAQWIRN